MNILRMYIYWVGVLLVVVEAGAVTVAGIVSVAVVLAGVS